MHSSNARRILKDVERQIKPKDAQKLAKIKNKLFYLPFCKAVYSYKALQVVRNCFGTKNITRTKNQNKQ
ncbi:hypothetical protein ABT56_13565 [Photobacterium aquae]|uniref:Uncharacterized protein n=1 Tax=Photobacterium aquae TaxID=1195763 RepID=A0A0J1GZ42_9GAMM|nr:hypothetical protein ABT56_13565 [Photobacterium aquae]